MNREQPLALDTYENMAEQYSYPEKFFAKRASWRLGGIWSVGAVGAVGAVGISRLQTRFLLVSMTTKSPKLIWIAICEKNRVFSIF